MITNQTTVTAYLNITATVSTHNTVINAWEWYVFVTDRYSLSVCTPFLLASLYQYHVMVLMKTILLLVSLKLMDSSFILRNFPLIWFIVQLMSPGQILSFLQHKMFLILVSLCLSVSASSSPSPPQSPSPHFFLPLSLSSPPFTPLSFSLSLSHLTIPILFIIFPFRYNSALYDTIIPSAQWIELHLSVPGAL